MNLPFPSIQCDGLSRHIVNGSILHEFAVITVNP